MAVAAAAAAVAVGKATGLATALEAGDSGEERYGGADFYAVGGVISGGVAVVPLTTTNMALPGGMAPTPLLPLLPEKLQDTISHIDLVFSDVPLYPPSRRFMGLARGVEWTDICLVLVKHLLVELGDRSSVVHGLENGVFGVYKTEELVRLIMDARPINAQTLLDPVFTLPAAEHLTKLALPPEGMFCAFTRDLSNFYHQLLLPAELRRWLPLPRIWHQDKWQYPRWRTLPMGWKAAVALAQIAHTTHVMANSEAMASAIPLYGRLTPVNMGMGDRAQGIYLDDTLGLEVVPLGSTSVPSTVRDFAASVDEAAPTPANAKKAVGPTLSDPVRTWGYELVDGHAFSPPSESLRKLVLQPRSLLISTGRISRAHLRTLVGRWLWYCLLVRPLLSQFSPLFRQCRSRRRAVKLWPSSASTLGMLCTLSPLLRVSARRSAEGHVFASDASLSGSAVVLSAGRDCYWDFASLCYYKGREDLHDPALYTEPLAAAIKKADFGSGFVWQHERQEDIGILEARAAFNGLLRVLTRSGGDVCERRLLGLVDNSGVVGAFTKGRSRNVTTNALIGRMSALLLATGSTLDLVWVPTDLQPADEGSRRGPRRVQPRPPPPPQYPPHLQKQRPWTQAQMQQGRLERHQQQPLAVQQQQQQQRQQGLQVRQLQQQHRVERQQRRREQRQQQQQRRRQLVQPQQQQQEQQWQQHCQQRQQQQQQLAQQAQWQRQRRQLRQLSDLPLLE